MAIGVDARPQTDPGHRGPACGTVDPELFHPVTEIGPVARQQIAAAKEICAGCPLRVVCLRAAVDGREYGIWGGTTDRERLTMLSATARRARRGALAGALATAEADVDTAGCGHGICYGRGRCVVAAGSPVRGLHAGVSA